MLDPDELDAIIEEFCSAMSDGVEFYQWLAEETDFWNGLAEIYKFVQDQDPWLIVAEFYTEFSADIQSGWTSNHYDFEDSKALAERLGK